MSEIDTIAAEIAHLYPAVYARLHARWALGEKRPSAESLAVLQHLWQTGPLTVGEAARHFERAPSAVSELVDRLEANDWIARSPDGRDRRRTLLWLTDAGRAVLERSQQVLAGDALRAALAHMTDVDRERLVGGLRALVAAASLSHPPRSEP